MESRQREVAVPHGVKRKASDPPPDEQRLTKRFDRLNLDNGHHPSPHLPTAAAPHQQQLQPPPPQAPPRPSKDDYMQLEDTKDKVYIYDLDAELADEPASDEENPIFIPDIEKHMTKIPKHVLTGQAPREAPNQELVLYSVPTSLSVPREQDSVRRAIIEARARARARGEGQAGAVREIVDEGDDLGLSNGVVPSGGGGGGVLGQGIEDGDPDAMDIG